MPVVAAAFHPAGCRAVDIQLDIVDKKAFLWLQPELFKQALIDLFLRLDAFFFRGKQDPVKQTDPWDDLFIAGQEPDRGVGAGWDRKMSEGASVFLCSKFQK